MAVPKYHQFMLPLLQFMGDGKEHHVSEAVEPLSDYFGLSQEDRDKLLRNSKQTLVYYRIHWANTYLKKAGLLESTRRGYIRITDRGFSVLEDNPSILDKTYLSQFPEFLEFITPNKNSDSDDEIDDIDTASLAPKELIENSYRNIVNDLADQLLESVLSASPAFFEQLVVDLLLSMGYGSALQDAGQAIGQTNDGGVDGYIQEDKLGLDTIYIQAKRWADNTVGRPDVQAFVGSLIGLGATKGVFITTSTFSRGAIEYAQSMQNVRVILIDGQQLAQLMIEHNVGVSVEKTYTIKQLDENYFPD